MIFDGVHGGSNVNSPSASVVPVGVGRSNMQPAYGLIPSASRTPKPTTPSAARKRAQRVTGSLSAAIGGDGPRQQIGQRVNRVDVGRRRAREPAKFHHRADQRLELQRPPGLHVL